MKRLILCFVLLTASAFGEKTVEGYYGALTREDLKLATRIAVKKDIQAWAEMIMSGRLVAIPPNKEVDVLESTWDGVRKIRFVGTTKVFWVPMEAVKE